MKNTVANDLIHEKSPYLLQHAHNPVNWFAWGKKAFEKAKLEDKPIFLSIGYSTCHWCHVMERESFENEAIAKILNDYFVCIKVDKEERPDIDSIYMRVCQAFTGSGGWPTSIFMNAEQKPFFAGTYFPPANFTNLLYTIQKNWHDNRSKLIQSGNEVVKILSQTQEKQIEKEQNLYHNAYSIFCSNYDKEYGGFGSAPKFPSPHNLLFLMQYAQYSGKKTAMDMSEHTLLNLYKGGIFDHIGFGFSRYSTDKFWLAPHFEKMLYDNALLAVAYLYLYEQTDNPLYKNIAQKIFIYVNRELSNGSGGFYAAQDADSEGIEGNYYVLSPDEVISVLGQTDGSYFNAYFNITSKGNFEGKNIPNLIHQNPPFACLDEMLNKLYAYRKTRMSVHKDTKVLTAWNALMLWANASAYRILKDETYLQVAEQSIDFINNNLMDSNTLYVSITDGERSIKGFLDDYAFSILALISLYQSTFKDAYLQQALALNEKVIAEFYDENKGGFYLYAKESEQLILRPKESYDGAMPSGNSVMAYNLIRLAKLTKDDKLDMLCTAQQQFMQKQASDYPSGYGFFLFATLPSKDIVCVLKNKEDIKNITVKSNWIMRVLESATKEYPLVNDQTTFYICKDNHCLPPTNDLSSLI